MNISIFASIGAQNLGDELILKNEIELLREEFTQPSSLEKTSEERSEYDYSEVGQSRRDSEVSFRVASYDASNPMFQIQNTQYFEYFPIGIKNPKNTFRNIKNFFKYLRVIAWSDIVVIGGGGIIYDSEIQSVGNPLNQWLLRVRCARLFGKKIYFYAVGVDIKQVENSKKLKKIFRKAWKITVRDKKSQQQLAQVGIKSNIVDDPVMRDILPLKKGVPEERGGGILGVHNSKNFKLQDFKKYDFSGKKVGLALRSGYIGISQDARVEKLLVEELCQYIEMQGGKVVFLPHSIHLTDMQANDYEFMKQFLNYDREIYASLGEVYTAYTHKMLDVVLSMRLHSIILSYIYGIDQIVLSYSQKTDEIIKKLRK